MQEFQHTSLVQTDSSVLTASYQEAGLQGLQISAPITENGHSTGFMMEAPAGPSGQFRYKTLTQRNFGVLTQMLKDAGREGWQVAAPISERGDTTGFVMEMPMEDEASEPGAMFQYVILTHMNFGVLTKLVENAGLEGWQMAAPITARGSTTGFVMEKPLVPETSA